MTENKYNSSYQIENEQQLAEIAENFSKKLPKPLLLLLQGSLGSGKTTFCKYLFKNFGISPNQVKSPTYSLINNFHIQNLEINHIDLYRLEKPDPILTEEIRQLTEIPDSLTAIEWPERMDYRQLIRPGLSIIKIKFTILENNSRKITIENLS